VPIVKVDAVEQGHAIVENCPGCGENHRHGLAGEGEMMALEHRVAHCGGNGYTGYYLIITSDTERR
jgi:hypothetical protein